MTSQHDKAKRWQFGLRSLFVIMLLIAVPLSGLVWFAREHRQVQIDALVQSLKVGMTRDEVRDRLGDPSDVNGSELTYWRTVIVRFDEHNRVEHIKRR